MEAMEPENEDIRDHVERCRLCLASISECDIFYQINEEAKVCFETLTPYKLNLEDQRLSHLCCVECQRSLLKFKSFHDLLTKTYEQLNKFLSIDDCETQFELNPQSDVDNSIEMTYEYLQDDIDVASQGDEEQFSDEEMFESVASPQATVEPQIANNSLIMNETSQKVRRPKAWTWTREMEIDLIRYYNKYKSKDTSSNLAFTKISRKFKQKGYPNISQKSIKYKFEKLRLDPEKLKNLQEAAEMVLIDDSSDIEPLPSSKKTQAVKKSYCAWVEEMEVLLLFLVIKTKRDQPAIPDNALFRRVTQEMQLEGYEGLTEHIISYHYKKLKRDKEKERNLQKKVQSLEAQYKEALIELSSWSQTCDKDLLMHKKFLHEQFPDIKPNELWKKLRQNFELDGCGSYSDCCFKTRYVTIMLDQGGTENDTAECNDRDNSISGQNRKRNYIYWTEAMKEALINFRNELHKQTPPGELWDTVAQRMNDRGFGKFFNLTGPSVRYKYFNLKRNKESDRSFYLE